MRKTKFLIGVLAVLAMASACFFVLKNEKALVIHPKGIIAHKELKLIVTNLILMLIIIIPTFILILVVAWKYRANNPKAEYHSKKSYRVLKDLLLWIIPSIIVAIMAVVTWKATHELDPYKPLESHVKPLTIQVIALDWKWLFIYPDQGIATVNFVQFPDHTPIHFKLSADGSPMNSFWIPQLSGQIYCMAGMITPLYIMADGPGVYSGKAAEINGKGYAKMTFVAKSSSQYDFDDWVTYVQTSPLKLDNLTYEELIKPTIDHPIILFSDVETELFKKITMKYMHPHTKS